MPENPLKNPETQNWLFPRELGSSEFNLSMSEFDMCDRIQELIPRMDYQSNFAGFSKNSTMNATMDPYGFHDQSEECFDCPFNGKICSEPMEFAGKSVIVIIMAQ